MQSTASHSRSSHPLSGVECWPKSGPVYGLSDQPSAPPPSLWTWLSERLRRSPSGDNAQIPNARIWY